MPSRTAHLAALAAIAFAVGGCGDDKKNAVDVSVHTSTEPAKTVTVTTPATTPSEPTNPQNSGGASPSSTIGTSATLRGALRTVRRAGYVVDDDASYQFRPLLRVLIGVRRGSADGHAQRAFFFVGSRYIGTDTSQDSAHISVLGQTRRTVTLSYAVYRPNDPLCCPTGKNASVRFHWNGTRLVPLDPIPSRRG